MRKKSQAAKIGLNGNLSVQSTEAELKNTMTGNERPKGTNPSLKKFKSPLASQSSSKKKVNRFPVRRSERIQNATPQNLKIQTVIEEIIVSESEEESELPADQEKNLPPADQENDWPELMMGEMKFEGKINYIITLLETHGHTLESVKTEVMERSFLTKMVSTADVNYKSMYIASQKKIEELAEENRVLAQKLENAICRFEEYKNGNHDAVQMLEKLKDTILISNGLRVSESTQAMSRAELDKVTSLDAGNVPPSSKRKKFIKLNEI